MKIYINYNNANINTVHRETYTQIYINGKDQIKLKR